MDTLNIKYRTFCRFAMAICLVVMMGACASSKVPAPNTSSVESDIRQAEQAGAQEYAPLELRNARKKVDQAKALVEAEEYKKAARLVEEASVDAELATVTARSKKAQEAVSQLRDTIETLREEIKRKQRN